MELTEAELQAKIDTGVSAAVEGLQNKNTELLGKLKTATGLNKGFDGIDVEALQADSAALAEIKTNQQKKSGKFEDLYNTQKGDHEKVLSDKDTEIADLSSTLATERKGTALTKELVKGVAIPELIGTAVGILESKIELNDKGDAMVGDESLEKYMETWKTSEVGKHFFTDGNSGGSGNGDGGGANETDADFFNPKSDRYSMTMQSKVARKSPELFKKYKKLFKK